MKLLSILHCFLPIAFLRKLRHSEVTCPRCRAGMRTKGSGILLEVPESAKASTSGGSDFCHSQRVNYILHPPVCLGRLGAQPVLVECGWTMCFKLKMSLRIENAGTQIFFPDWRRFLTVRMLAVINHRTSMVMKLRFSFPASKISNKIAYNL